MFRFRILAVVAGCSLIAAAQSQPPKVQIQKRDLKIEEIEPDAPAPTRKAAPRSWAVIIGISKYPKLPPGDLQLRFPERDAQSINTILISKEGGNFKAENTHMLTGSKATLAAIRSEIGQWLPEKAQEDDRVLIYFAGHGFIDPKTGKGYLAPYDVDPKNIPGTALPMDELGSIVGTKIRAKNKILLTDACHSGAISPEDVESLNRNLLNVNRSLFSLTASRDREVSLESDQLDGGHGLFTYYVVTGLGGEADADRDGFVTADELAEYVHTQVRDAAAKGGYHQNPTSDRGSFDPDLFLASVPAHARPANAPAPKFGTFVFEANTDGVEVFLDGTSLGVIDRDHRNIIKPGLQVGQHTVQGVKMGFEPDGPRQETVNPGEETTVSFKIQFPRHRKQAAVDALDKGIEEYNKRSNYKKAIDSLQKALSIDPNFSQAAYYLGLSYNALFDSDKAKQYFEKAIAIDPDYIEARANYGGMLLDTGATDDALRQFNAVLVRNPNHVEALSNQAEAYRLKDLYPQSIESAQKAIQLAPKVPQAHLWLGDSLRLTGKYLEARSAYADYLRLSNYDSGAAGQVNYYVLGFLIGFGKKTRAGTVDIWKDMRSLAYFGMCDSERRLGAWDQAIQSCLKALRYDPKDPFAHFALGATYMAQAIETGDVAGLAPAAKHLQQVIDINPYIDEAKYAKKNLDQIRTNYPTVSR
jgi:tetratricopeptide (TPR) repeat protein